MAGKPNKPSKAEKIWGKPEEVQTPDGLTPAEIALLQYAPVRPAGQSKWTPAVRPQLSPVPGVTLHRQVPYNWGVGSRKWYNSRPARVVAAGALLASGALLAHAMSDGGPNSLCPTILPICGGNNLPELSGPPQAVDSTAEFTNPGNPGVHIKDLARFVIDPKGIRYNGQLNRQGMLSGPGASIAVGVTLQIDPSKYRQYFNSSRKPMSLQEATQQSRAITVGQYLAYVSGILKDPAACGEDLSNIVQMAQEHDKYLTQGRLLNPIELHNGNNSYQLPPYGSTGVNPNYPNIIVQYGYMGTLQHAVPAAPSDPHAKLGTINCYPG